MKDFQVWFYVILGIIYVVTRFMKKQEQPPTDQAPKRPEKPVQRYEEPASKPAPGPKTLTFEELLREITESKTVESKPVAVPPVPKATYVDYDDNLPEEEEDLEDEEYDNRKRDQVYNVYEEAKRQAFERPSLEETMKAGETVGVYGKFKAFQEVPQRNLMEEYLGNLNDPEGWKKAVVMSEILNRKF
jgi:hypothetical protein